jgi:hypothetical protein
MCCTVPAVLGMLERVVHIPDRGRVRRLGGRGGAERRGDQAGHLASGVRRVRSRAREMIGHGAGDDPRSIAWVERGCPVIPFELDGNILLDPNTVLSLGVIGSVPGRDSPYSRQ